MPTTAPRVNVTFDPLVREILLEISKAQNASLSEIVNQLVRSALELAEDLALVQYGEERLRNFRRDDALTSEELLKWNKGRKKSK